MKDTIWIKKGRFTPLAVVLMFALPLVTALICLCFGRMNVPVGEVLTALRTALTGGSTSNVQNYSIVINLRLPRILMAIIVGAGLSCAGNTYQSLFSNPLATPDILGVTSGTCVGAILAIILSCSILETQLIALVFGLISVCFTLKIAGKSDGRSMVYLVLAGTIASSLFNALGSLLKYTAGSAGQAAGDHLLAHGQLYQCQLPKDPDWLPTYRCWNHHHLSAALAAEHPFTE